MKTPKEEAVKLIERFEWTSIFPENQSKYHELTKKIVLVYVDERIQELSAEKPIPENKIKYIEFLQQVKIEIEKP